MEKEFYGFRDKKVTSGDKAVVIYEERLEEIEASGSECEFYIKANMLFEKIDSVMEKYADTHYNFNLKISPDRIYDLNFSIVAQRDENDLEKSERLEREKQMDLNRKEAEQKEYLRLKEKYEK